MNYQDFDFIEIGTSNFDTLIQKASDNTYGISVEPVKQYLDQLPEKINVKKINCAISFDNVEGLVDLYYIPENLIKKYNLPNHTYGCNSINGYHPLHKRLQIENLVQIEKIPQIPISKLLIDNYVKKIGHLKIDTEGGDSDILIHLIEYLKNKDNIFFPEQITFESNYLTSKSKIQNVINQYICLGYKILKHNNKNTIMVKK